MSIYYITHTDTSGERHQLSGAWEAETPEDAIVQMLSESSSENDGGWEAHLVISDGDIIHLGEPA